MFLGLKTQRKGILPRKISDRKKVQAILLEFGYDLNFTQFRKSKERTFVEAEIQDICKLYKEERKTVQEIADKYIVDLSLVLEALSNGGVFFKNEKKIFRPTVKQERDICRLFDGGMRIPKLAEKYGCSKNCIRSILKRRKNG